MARKKQGHKKIIVLVANIAIKVLHYETDSEAARRFLQACATEKARIMVPEHFLHELINVCQRLNIAIQNALELGVANYQCNYSLYCPLSSATHRCCHP